MSKITQIFKNIGKSPSQIHKPNIYSESLAETKSKGDYENSVSALSPTTYQQANKLNFSFALWYANLYHVISAGLGLATVAMLAFIFSGAGAGAKYPTWLLYGMFGLTFIILCALLFGIEIFKSSLAKGIFKNLVTGAKVKMPAVFGLVLVMLFSILVSAVGGAVLSYEMNDKSTQINEIYSVQADSIRKQHDKSLQDVNASISSYKANLNKGDYWAKYATREKLDKAIETRNNLLATAKNDITSVQAAKEKEVSLNSSEGKNYAIISAITVFVLELLSILAYWFQYVYHSNCEREAVNFGVLSPSVAVHQTENKNESDLAKIENLLQNILSGNNNLQLAGNIVNPSSQKVGFSFGANKDNAPVITTPLNASVKQVHIGDEIECEYCQKKIIKKTITHRFCSSKCRMNSGGYIPNKKKKI